MKDEHIKQLILCVLLTANYFAETPFSKDEKIELDQNNWMLKELL